MSVITTPIPLPQPATTPTHVDPFTRRLSYVSITPGNLDILKALNSKLFPVPYPDAYYAVTMRPELAKFCLLIYLDNVPVGQVTCTFKPSEREGETKLYWMLMGVLPEYRGHGIGGCACQTIMNAVAEHNHRLKTLRAGALNYSPQKIGADESKGDAIERLSAYPISTQFMHVYVLNTGARRLYECFGFTETKRIDNFYRRRGPEDKAIKDAWLLEKRVELVKE
ncbi:hypothetical protein FRC12_005150 [Ceratobasidium sp. 428]|nr:hypothetical protein FRC12_005150 [Ceratobasidium sp. 428]